MQGKRTEDERGDEDRPEVDPHRVVERGSDPALLLLGNLWVEFRLDFGGKRRTVLWPWRKAAGFREQGIGSARDVSRPGTRGA